MRAAANQLRLKPAGLHLYMVAGLNINVLDASAQVQSLTGSHGITANTSIGTGTGTGNTIPTPAAADAVAWLRRDLLVFSNSIGVDRSELHSLHVFGGRQRGAGAAPGVLQPS